MLISSISVIRVSIDIYFTAEKGGAELAQRKQLKSGDHEVDNESKIFANQEHQRHPYIYRIIYRREGRGQSLGREDV